MPRGRDWVMGEQLAQVDNRDPFAPPVWRSPVYRTPEPVILVVQLVRLIWRLLWFALTHPGVDAVAALVVVTWLGLGWPGVVGLAVIAVVGLAGLRVLQPSWFARFVAVPVRDWLAWWFYRRRWKAAMTLAGLAPDYRGQPVLPVLDRVHRAGAVDLVRAGLVTGQAPADFEARAENLAHAFGARLCRIRNAAPGVVVLELVRADTLADPIGALPITGEVDLAGLPVGRCEDGSPWRLRLAATHVLIAGATGSGKGSVIWSLIRALLPAIASGWVQVWALDPKRMELSFGRALFYRYACHAAAMVELLEAAVAEMHDRAGQFGGRTRTFTPSYGVPVRGGAGGRAGVPDRLPARTGPAQTGRGRHRHAHLPGPVGGGVRGRRAAGPAQGRDQPAEPVLHPHRAAAGRVRPGGHGARRRRPGPRRPGRPDLTAALHRRRGGIRAAGGLPRPGTGPRRLRQRRRHLAMANAVGYLPGGGL